MTKPATASEIGPEDEEAGSNQKNQGQASTAQTKHGKIQGLTKC